MSSAGAGGDFQEGVAGRGELPDWNRKLHGCKTAEERNRLSADLFAVPAFLEPVRDLPQRMIDNRLFISVSPHYRQVSLAYQPGMEGVRDLPRRFGGKGEQKRPGGGAIQAVDRIDTAARLVPRKPHGEYRLAAIHIAPVHEHAGRFVHRHEMAITVKNGKDVVSHYGHWVISPPLHGA